MERCTSPISITEMVLKIGLNSIQSIIVIKNSGTLDRTVFSHTESWSFAKLRPRFPSVDYTGFTWLSISTLTHSHTMTPFGAPGKQVS